MASFLAALAELHDTLVTSLSSCGFGLDGGEAKPELMRRVAGSCGGYWWLMVPIGSMYGQQMLTKLEYTDGKWM